MITRGIVEAILDKYTVKIRMPIFNQTASASNRTSLDDLNEAKICTMANVDPNLQVGDVVFVAFEDNNYGSPVVIGYMYRAQEQTSFADMRIQSLRVNWETQLSSDTSIGEVNSSEIAALSGARSNLQKQIDALSTKIEELQKYIDAKEKSSE